MLTDGSQFFLYLPGESSQRVLHPATVTEIDGETMMAVVYDDTIPIEAGAEGFIFFEHRRTFMQQPIRIDAVLSQDFNGDDDEHAEALLAAQHHPAVTAAVDEGENESAADRLLFGFKTTGEAVSAESRQCYRVSTVVSPAVSAVLNDEAACPVLDVSATGFSVLTDAELRPGQVVRTKLDHADVQCNGTAIVQSATKLPDGRTRYGMYCAGNEHSNGDLLKGLQRISAALQRVQLQRITGTGG